MYGLSLGLVMLSAILDGASGPWLTGMLYDLTGGDALAFWISATCSNVSVTAIWFAAHISV